MDTGQSGGGGLDLLLCITLGDPGAGENFLHAARTLVAVVLVWLWVWCIVCLCNTPDYIKIGTSFVSHNCLQLLTDSSELISHRENHFKHVADTSRVLI